MLKIMNVGELMMIIKSKRLIYVIGILLLTFSSFRATSMPPSDVTLVWYQFFQENVVLGWKVVELKVETSEPLLLGRERLTQDDIIQISIVNGLPTDLDEIIDVSAFLLLDTFLNGERVEKQELNDFSFAPQIFALIMPIKFLVDNMEVNTSYFLNYSVELIAKIQGDYMIVQDNGVLCKFHKESGILYEIIQEIHNIFSLTLVYYPEASTVDITGKPTTITDKEDISTTASNSASTPGFDIMLLVTGVGLLSVISRILTRKRFYLYLRGCKNEKNGDHN